MKFIRDESHQKLRGGYYTDAGIAAYLLDWVAEISPSRILEPSCGDGVFIKEALKTAALGLGTRLVGVEVDQAEAKKARALGSADRVSVLNADFLELSAAGFFGTGQFDGVVGNPPYIRYQYLSAESQSLAESIIRGQNLRFTKHTNAWVPFVVASLSALRPGGRLAMVIPAELMSVIHADSIRQLLLRECARVLYIDPEELLFPETLQGVGLLLAEKNPAGVPKGSRARVGVAAVQGRSFLGRSASALFEDVVWIEGVRLPGKWTHALLTDGERDALDRVVRNPAVHRFAEVATVAVGIVTGANKFFLVPDQTVEDYDLAKHAHPMFGRSEHVEGVIYDLHSHEDNRRRGLPSNFLWFSEAGKGSLSAGARRYIALGEAQDLHTRFKCRIRTPWYAVPSVFPSSVGMLKRSHEYPRLILNEIDALTTDTAYRVEPVGVSGEALVGSFVNSLTALSAELEGRHYGGGVLELVPSEINRLLLPIAQLSRSDLERLDNQIRAGIALSDLMRSQDELVLASIGIAAGDIVVLRAAANRLRQRRLRTRAEGDEELEPIDGSTLNREVAGA